MGSLCYFRAMNFTLKSFEELSTTELYDLLRLRSEVFVVEQNCVYQDIDNYDQKSLHLFGNINDELLAYVRILPPKLYYAEAAIGRVVTAKKIRMEGAGKEIMKYAIEKTFALFPKANIRIMAQCYLAKFYTDFGFAAEGPEFLEDGIPHVEMVLER